MEELPSSKIYSIDHELKHYSVFHLFFFRSFLLVLILLSQLKSSGDNIVKRRAAGIILMIIFGLLIILFDFFFNKVLKSGAVFSSAGMGILSIIAFFIILFTQKPPKENVLSENKSSKITW